MSLTNEDDLHFKVVDYIRRFYKRIAKTLIVACGENQDTTKKRIDN